MSRWSLPVLGLVLMASAALGGCGFTPLYATPGVTPALESVDVVAPDGRAGFLVRDELQDALARDRSAAARYRLTYTVHQLKYPRGLRVNNIATGYELDLTVDYALTEIATGTVVYRGNAPVQVSYNSADAPYAGIAAQQDAEQRAAQQAAVLIRLDLSRYFLQTAKK